MNKLLPLFSKRFREMIHDLVKKYDSPIGEYLKTVDNIIEGFNYVYPTNGYAQINSIPKAYLDG